MTPETRDLILRIHARACPAVLALTGGGTTAAAWLLSVPGGSKSVLEVVVPYASDALDAWLGSRPESSCSALTAVKMAERAFDIARARSPGDAVGVGCTASLASDRPKRGDHRVHVAAVGTAGTVELSLVLTKDARSRDEEEAVASRLVLECLAQALRIPSPPLDLLPGEKIDGAVRADTDALARLIRGDLAKLTIDADGRLDADAVPPLLVPGSFNPLHAGHVGLARAAESLTGLPAAFELSIANVDKPTLDAATVRARAAAFAWRHRLVLTRAPGFLAKARLFPGSTFAVGADTAARIVDPKYYDGTAEGVRRGLAVLAGLGCRFLVAGRVDATGAFVEIDSLPVPADFRAMFTAIPADVFRVDLSSTALRAATPTVPH